MGFGDSVKLSVAKMEKSLSDNILATTTDLFNTTVSLTPVATNMTFKGLPANPGELINNWYTGYGINVSDKSYNHFAANILGSDSYQRISEVAKSVEFIGKDSEISLTNSTPYGFRAEYAGWPAPKWTGKSVPYGMVRNALLQVAAKGKGK